MIFMKRCPRCGEEKEATEFYNDRTRKSGKHTYCKTCVIIFRTRNTMNQTNFEKIYRGLSAQAKKVYEAIPISEPWKESQIMGELHRIHPGMNGHVVMGCANSLVDCGLVIESPNRSFKRVEIRPAYFAACGLTQPTEEKATKTEPQKEIEMKQIETTPATGDAMEMLGKFAQKLRALASEAEVIALEIAAQAEKNEAETAKMRQLQALLKSLG